MFVITTTVNNRMHQFTNDNSPAEILAAIAVLYPNAGAVAIKEVQSRPSFDSFYGMWFFANGQYTEIDLNQEA